MTQQYENLVRDETEFDLKVVQTLTILEGHSEWCQVQKLLSCDHSDLLDLPW